MFSNGIFKDGTWCARIRADVSLQDFLEELAPI